MGKKKKNLKNKKNQKNQTDGALTNGHVRKGQEEEDENDLEEEEENEEEYRAEISAKEILKKLEWRIITECNLMCR